MSSAPIPAPPPDANQTRRGLMNALAQTFNGVKSFLSILRLANIATASLPAPSSLIEGAIAYSTTSKKLVTCDGSNWLTPEGLPLATTDITYYVSPSGNDSNNGLTVGTPLLTIAAARAKVAEDIQADVRIKLAAGTYNEYLAESRNFKPDSIAGKASLLFEGDFADFTPATGLSSGTFDASFGTQAIANTALVTGAGWTVDNLKGAFVEVTSGPALGFRIPVASNAAGSVDLAVPANTTNGTGRNLQSQTFKLVKPSVIITHPLTSTNALVSLSGTSAKQHGTTSSVIKQLGAFSFYGIEFRSTLARTLVQIYGQEARFEACLFNQSDTTANALGVGIQSVRAGSFFSVTYSTFTAANTPTNQATHIAGGGNNAASSHRITAVVFDYGNTGLSTGFASLGNVFAAVFQYQRSIGWQVDGGIASSSGSAIFRGITSTALSQALSFGSQSASGASIFSQPSIGLFKIMGCSIGIIIQGPGYTNRQQLRNVIIDGCGVGVLIAAPYSGLSVFGAQIINSTVFGVQVKRLLATTADVFHSGFEFTSGGLTMSGNVADFTLDGTTPITYAAIVGAPGGLTTNTKFNFIAGV